MFSVNEVRLIGNLGKDVELKFTLSGMAVTTLSVATSYRMKDGQDKTTWHQVQVWDKQAESCASFLKKGSRVYIDGRIETQSWEGREGQKHSRQIVVAQRVGFLSATELAQSPSPGPGADDDIPF